jgi:hypothetical protein
MKKFKVSSLLLGLGLLSFLQCCQPAPSQAAFVVGGENGWQMSFDGMLNAFMVYSMTSTPPKGNVEGGAVTIGWENRDRQTFRVRTGLLPSIVAFNVKSPTINGVDYGARFGLYPQINNDTTRTGFGPDTLASALDMGSRIDIREMFMTADGKFGQFLIGRALCLYQGKNILTDMTLIGVGVPGSQAIGGGTTLGHIGYGYLYATFNAQFRYTTPDFSGFKAAVSINDPSRITHNLTPSGGGYAADKTNQPRFETELSYAKKLSFGDLSTWVSALYQEAQNSATHHKVSSIGGAGGVTLGIGPVSIQASGYGGQALGTTFLQDQDSLDLIGKERTQYGGLFQVKYTIGPATIGANYGINYADRTNFDKAQQFGFGTGNYVLKSQQAATGGVYYSLNKYLTLVGEYTWARNSWYNSEHQDVNAISLGTVFVW